jgi:hypothetical protein
MIENRKNIGSCHRMLSFGFIRNNIKFGKEDATDEEVNCSQSRFMIIYDLKKNNTRQLF